MESQPDKYMKHFVTVATGFIGSTLMDRHLRLGHGGVGFENCSTAQERHLSAALRHALIIVDRTLDCVTK